MANLFFALYVIQYITALRSVPIKNQARIATAKFSFLLKRSSSALRKIFTGKH